MREDWARLGDAVRRRREELDLTQADVQERGGPSPALVRSLENKRATTLSPSKRRDLERALDWAPNSVDHVLAGGDPDPFAVDAPMLRLFREEEQRVERILAASRKPQAEWAHPDVQAARMAEAVRARRDQLGLTVDDLAVRADLSMATVNAIESGGSLTVSSSLLRKLDKGLRWAPGSAKAVVFGGDPEPLETARSPREQEMYERFAYVAAEITSLTTALNLLAKVHPDVLPVAEQSDELARRAVTWALAWARDGEDDGLSEALLERVRRWADAQKVPDKETAEAMHPSRRRVLAELREVPAEHQVQWDEMVALLSNASEIGDFAVVARTLSGRVLSLAAFAVFNPTTPHHGNALNDATQLEKMFVLLVKHDDLPMVAVEVDHIPRDEAGRVIIAELPQDALRTK